MSWLDVCGSAVWPGMRRAGLGLALVHGQRVPQADDGQGDVHKGIGRSARCKRLPVSRVLDEHPISDQRGRPGWA